MSYNQEQNKKSQMMEIKAEHKVFDELISKGIIIAKPCVDIMGADLLAIMEIEDGAKFARIQCKGRTLKTLESNCSIPIEKSYIKGTFTCLVYIKCDFDGSEHLYCFFSHDIKSRKDLWKESGEKFRASFYGKTFKKKYYLHTLTDAKITHLKEIIKESDSEKEFDNVFLKLESKLPTLKLTASMSESD